MESFKTKEEAQERCRSLNQEVIHNKKFYPLVKDECKQHRCISWSEARPTPTKDRDVWYASSAGCTNMIISGFVSVENYA